MAVGTERRKHARFDVPCRLRIERRDAPALRTRTLNVSDGGALFPAPAAPGVGEAFHVRLSVPRETSNTFFLEQFAVRARVVRQEARRGSGEATAVAVEFERPLHLDLP